MMQVSVAGMHLNAASPPNRPPRAASVARSGEGGSERSRAVRRRCEAVNSGRKRVGKAVSATETGRRGLGTVLSGDGQCLARA